MLKSGPPINIIINTDAQKILDAFSSCFEIRIAFFSPDGIEQAVGLQRPCCSFCTLVREDLGKKRVCLDLDNKKRAEAMEKGSPVVYSCHAGMTEVIAPVFFENCHLGYGMIGQFRTADYPSAGTARDWTMRGGDKKFLIEAFRSAPLFPPEKVPEIRDLFLVLVHYIVGQRMVFQRETVLLERIHGYIRDHLHEPITLRDLSSAAGKSVSTLTHLFAERPGRGIKEFIIESKCRKAKDLLENSPGCTVKEAAAAVGYQDQYYFSRIYKKYMGHPPRADKPAG